MRFHNLACLLILKTRRFGYDGKGQFVIRSEEDIATAWQTLGSVSLILEGFVNFPAKYPLSQRVERWRNSFLSAFRKYSSRWYFVHIACTPADAMQAAG
jgi:phosphoribosylaminoimidazole carboxylase (NCAIR synthetase)